MTLKRWGLAFIRLGALLLAIGVLPAIVMAVLMPTATRSPYIGSTVLTVQWSHT